MTLTGVPRPVFKFKELTEKAKQKAKDDFANDEGYTRADDALKSIQALAEHFDGKMTNWSIDFFGGTPSTAEFSMPGPSTSKHWLKLCQEDCEWLYADEQFEEMADANEWLYCFDGSMAKDKPIADHVERAFVHTLDEDPSDESTRQVYADWLEEQGRTDDAERQRKWQTAYVWFSDLLAENWEHYVELSPGMDSEDICHWNWIPDLQTLLNAMTIVVCAYEGMLIDPVQHPPFVNCHSNQHLADLLAADHDTTWVNWRILTGQSFPHAAAVPPRINFTATERTEEQHRVQNAERDH